MKAKDKAEELVKKYQPYTYNDDGLNNAIDCALICVEEIISSYSELTLDGKKFPMRQIENYWLEVKQELIKMKG